MQSNIAKAIDGTRNVPGSDKAPADSAAVQIPASAASQSIPGGAAILSDPVNPVAAQYGEGELIEFIQEAADHSSVLLILPGAGISPDQARLLAKELAHKFRILVYDGPLPSVTDVYQFSAALQERLTKRNVKRSTILAAGSACNVAQAIAVTNPGSVRRLALVDPQSRMFPTFTTKVIDWLESHLPLGLPLRPTNEDFDSRPFLHRLRCPVLIVSTPEAGIVLRSEAAAMHRRIPNAVLTNLRPASSSYQHELGELVKDLLQRPVKRPQKNL